MLCSGQIFHKIVLFVDFIILLFQSFSYSYILFKLSSGSHLIGRHPHGGGSFLGVAGIINQNEI